MNFRDEIIIRKANGEERILNKAVVIEIDEELEEVSVGSLGIHPMLIKSLLVDIVEEM